MELESINNYHMRMEMLSELKMKSNKLHMKAFYYKTHFPECDQAQLIRAQELIKEANEIFKTLYERKKG